jgi:hypothetical protein
MNILNGVMGGLLGLDRNVTFRLYLVRVLLHNVSTAHTPTTCT